MSTYRNTPIAVLGSGGQGGRRVLFERPQNLGSSGADVQLDDARRGEQFRRSELGRGLRDVSAEPTNVQVGSEIETAIEESRRILELPHDWDGEGAPSYHPETLERAIAFVRSHAMVATRLGFQLLPPRILPGPNSSIDVLWRPGTFELLINFPDDPAAVVTFYGDDKRGTVVRGTLRPADAPIVSLVPWLIAQ